MICLEPLLKFDGAKDRKMPCITWATAKGMGFCKGHVWTVGNAFGTDFAYVWRKIGKEMKNFQFL